MLRTVLGATLARQVVDVVAKQALIEVGLLLRICYEQGTPNPLSRCGQVIRRIAALGRQDCKHGAIGVGQHHLAPAVRIVVRLKQHLAAVLQRALLRGIDVPYSQKGQPGWLLRLPGGQRLLEQPGYWLAIEQRQRVIRIARHAAEGPAEQRAVEALRAVEVRGHQIGPDDLADMVLAAGRLRQRRQDHRSAQRRVGRRDSGRVQQRGTQPLTQEIAGGMLRMLHHCLSTHTVRLSRQHHYSSAPVCWSISDGRCAPAQRWWRLRLFTHVRRSPRGGFSKKRRQPTRRRPTSGSPRALTIDSEAASPIGAGAAPKSWVPRPEGQTNSSWSLR